MPSFKITVEDTSPLISYSMGWQTGHSSGDSSANQYSQSSFTVTNVKDASVSFIFNGTAVEIFGAKRDNHGIYRAKVDNILYPPSTGKANPASFQASLFSAENLPQGTHIVTLTNQDTNYLDIDFITWETMIGTNSSDKIYVDVFQDTNPSFTYLPSETDWGLPEKNLGTFMGGSGHETTKSGASIVYSFEGDGVSLYGPLGPNGSPFVVRVDNGSARAFTTKQEFYTPQSILYHASSLGPGNHTLTLIYQPTDANQTIAIDYAAVFTTMTPSTTPKIGYDSEGMTSVARGVLGGLGVSVVLLLAMFGVLFRFLWQRRRSRIERTKSPQETIHYRDNIALPLSRLQTHTQPNLSRVPPVSITLNTQRFHKSGLDSDTPGSSETGSSVWVSPNLTTHRQPPLPEIENPPRYTENILDVR